MTRQTARGVAEALSGADASSTTSRSVAAAYKRTDEPVAPQRAPRFPDTPWGRLRATKGWSLRDLARRTGISAADLSRIERFTGGVTPDQARLLILVFDYREPENESATNPGPALTAYAEDYRAIVERGGLL